MIPWACSSSPACDDDLDPRRTGTTELAPAHRGRGPRGEEIVDQKHRDGYGPGLESPSQIGESLGAPQLRLVDGVSAATQQVTGGKAGPGRYPAGDLFGVVEPTTARLPTPPGDPGDELGQHPCAVDLLHAQISKRAGVCALGPDLQTEDESTSGPLVSASGQDTMARLGSGRGPEASRASMAQRARRGQATGAPRRTEELENHPANLRAS